MTTALEPSPATVKRLTARDVLFTDAAEAAAAIERAIEERNLLLVLPKEVPALTADTARFVANEVVQAIDSLLEALHVDDLLVSAWGQIEEVRVALEATATDHTVRHITLARHEIASDHSPRVELLVDEAPVPLLDLHLHLGFVIDACELVVRDGRIDHSEVGRLVAEGELTTSVTLLRHELGTVDPTRLFTGSPDAQ